MGGSATPPCDSLEGGFLQGIVCFPKHCVPFNPAILIGSPAGGQDGDPDSIPLTLSEGNGDGCGFVHWSGCGAGSLSRLCLSYQICGGIAPPLVDGSQIVTMASTLHCGGFLTVT